MEHIEYLKAPLGWDQNQPNPFTADGGYGTGWSCFCILDVDNDRVKNGRPGGELYRTHVSEADDGSLEERRSEGPYCYLMGRRVDSIETKLADFLRYESRHGRKVIISLPADFDADILVKQALQRTPNRSVVRQDDPIWWVHSTPLGNWEMIRDCGELRSIARLRRENLPLPGVGLFAFGEPADYAEYVMLALVEGIGPEHVVSSQQKGYLITEEDVPYDPGVRLYFNGHKIIRDGLAVSDGLHTIKVHDHLPLDPYLVVAIGAKDVDPNSDVRVWTPRTFLEHANRFFQERYCVTEP